MKPITCQTYGLFSHMLITFRLQSNTAYVILCVGMLSFQKRLPNNCYPKYINLVAESITYTVFVISQMYFMSFVDILSLKPLNIKENALSRSIKLTGQFFASQRSTPLKVYQYMQLIEIICLLYFVGMVNTLEWFKK